MLPNFVAESLLANLIGTPLCAVFHRTFARPPKVVPALAALAPLATFHPVDEDGGAERILDFITRDPSRDRIWIEGLGSNCQINFWT